MLFSEIPGLAREKNQLLQAFHAGKVPHAQLFIQKPGGPALALALAYGQYLNCSAPQASDSCGRCQSCIQFARLSYPDLHFSFPYAKTKEAPSKADADFYMRRWHEQILASPYFNLNDWLMKLGVENKQAIIPVHESLRIIQKLNLKSYTGGWKLMLIWLPEHLHPSAANKLLKTLEEPSPRTLIILISDNAERLLRTITSRCQQLIVSAFREAEIEEFLLSAGYSSEKSHLAAHLSGGQLHEAQSLAEESERFLAYAESFKTWMRACYAAKTSEIFPWVEAFSAWDRERQKEGLGFFLQAIQRSLAINFRNEDAQHPLFDRVSFDLSRFAPFIHQANAQAVASNLEEAIHDISRNGNPRIILSDISFKFSNLLRVKA